MQGRESCPHQIKLARVRSLIRSSPIREAGRHRPFLSRLALPHASLRGVQRPSRPERAVNSANPQLSDMPSGLACSAAPARRTASQGNPACFAILVNKATLPFDKVATINWFFSRFRPPTASGLRQTVPGTVEVIHFSVGKAIEAELNEQIIQNHW